MLKNNADLYKPGPSELSRDDLMYQVFAARVLTVDFERKVCTLQDVRTGINYTDINIFPATASAFESTEISMPEPGTTCIAAPVWWRGGYQQIAIIAYMAADMDRAQDAIAVRPIEGVEGYSNRRRGTYRKAFWGQKTVSNVYGYTEKIDGDWDRSGKDFTRDKLDSDRRQWTQIAGRRVEYSDAGVVFSGPINRPSATNIAPRTLPDGTQEFVYYLQPGAQVQDRYINGKQDVIPFAENTQRVQEYSLDYPLPPEVLETPLFDFILGTTQNPWNRTTVGGLAVTGSTVGTVQADSQTYVINQDADHPYTRGIPTVGPTTKEGPTPARRGFIVEKSEGTLVGYNLFDTFTYGQVLKPVLFPYTVPGRFGADVDSSYLPVIDSTDHIEARLAASAMAIRFPQEYNTVRWDVTKEGFISFEIGSTLPKENIPLLPANSYEHPHGAGRSMEGHLVGSLKLVIGKNRDEEDAIDLQALGQTVLRLGADDASLPNDRRSVMSQERGKMDTPNVRKNPDFPQYWSKARLQPNADAGTYGSPNSNQLKAGAENVSLRVATDGGIVARFGAKSSNALRRHLMNGYADPQGTQYQSSSNASRVDSKSPGRQFYAAGDSNYAFHDLTQAGAPAATFNGKPAGFPPYNASAWFGNPVPAGMDSYGRSIDIHTVADILVRAGTNPDNLQSLLADLAGGIVAWIGADKQGRSITASLDGGVQLVINKNGKTGKGLQLQIIGDVDLTVIGNWHQHVTGDIVMECAAFRQITKTDHVLTAQKIIESALTRITNEAPELIHNQGLYSSNENS
jgi:hypothetical protein